MSKSDRVVIVGAGPVGLSCALFLVTKGIDVIVLEAESALPGDMRASTLHPATLDMLRDCDIADQLTDQGFPAPQWQFARWDTGDAIIWDLATLSDVTAYPFRLQCEQFKLDEDGSRGAIWPPAVRHRLRREGRGRAPGQRRRYGDCRSRRSSNPRRWPLSSSARMARKARCANASGWISRGKPTRRLR